jgi:hypothetical protein
LPSTGRLRPTVSHTAITISTVRYLNTIIPGHPKRSNKWAAILFASHPRYSSITMNVVTMSSVAARMYQQ